MHFPGIPVVRESVHTDQSALGTVLCMPGAVVLVPLRVAGELRLDLGGRVAAEMDRINVDVGGAHGCSLMSYVWQREWKPPAVAVLEATCGLAPIAFIDHGLLQPSNFAASDLRACRGDLRQCL